MSNGDIITIKRVRVSFPHLFTKPTINGSEGKCGASLMLDPAANADAIAAIQAEVEALRTSRLKGRTLPADKICLRRGEDKGRPEYAGHMVLSANSRTRPTVVHTDGRTQIHSEEDNQIYAGCWVNARVRLWAQDNQYGKRINCELVAIQFAEHGEPFDGSYIAPEEAMAGFEAVEDPDDPFLNAA